MGYDTKEVIEIGMLFVFALVAAAFLGTCAKADFERNDQCRIAAMEQGRPAAEIPIICGGSD